MNKIYCFSNVVGGGDGVAYAMGDEGTVLGSHYCSNEYYVSNDLGVIVGCRPDRHVTYKKHFPDGYEMEFVRASDVVDHKGIQEAFRLNQLQGEEAEVKGSHASVEIECK